MFMAPSSMELSLTIILQKLDCLRSMEEVKQIQAFVFKSKPLQNHPLIVSKILYFCSLSPEGDIAHARSLLSHLPRPTPSMYNAVLRGFSRNNEEYPSSNPLFLYREMLEIGLRPDKFTFPHLLKALADLDHSLFELEMVHAHILKMGFDSDAYVINNLLRCCMLCGEIGVAEKLFDRFPRRDLVSWTTLISGYAKMGYGKEAIRVFYDMIHGSTKPDEVTLAIILSCCSELGDLELGKDLHRYIHLNRIRLDAHVGNALVDMYSKCGDIDSAYKFFGKMSNKNLVSWNTMISGLVSNGRFIEALSLFRRMQSQGVKPDSITLVGVLNSCANAGALQLGEWVHWYMDRNGIKKDGFLGNALIDMYAKCGRIDQAWRVFSAMARRDVYSYTAMLVGFAMHGRGEKALDLFSEMAMAGVKPNEVTLVGVLSACSHCDLVEAGLRHFEDMSKIHGLTPRIEHYGCVVHMLGRAGLFDEAAEFIKNMPVEPDEFIWGALLGACKIHGRVELGEFITRKLLELETEKDGTYVLMSNIYASAAAGDRRRDATEMRKAMEKQKVRKTPGCSLIEIDGTIHEFRIRDRSHPRRREIYSMADQIATHLKSETPIYI